MRRVLELKPNTRAQPVSYIHIEPKIKIMYSLDCSFYTAEFTCIGDLVAHVMLLGMDPNYEITRNGKGIGEQAADYLQF